MGTSNLTNKIKVHDIAKSFNLPSKEIMNILTEYSTPPKSHSAVMTEEEISIVLDYLTQKHQISSVEEIFADCFAPKAEQPKENKTKDAKAPAAKGRRAPESRPGARCQERDSQERQRKQARRIQRPDHIPRAQDQDRGHPQGN